MRSSFRNFLFLLGLAGSYPALAQVGLGTLNPDASAALDITSSSQGLLLPRLALTSNSDTKTVASPANGLVVFNTAATVGGAAGLVVNTGTAQNPFWQPLADNLGNHTATQNLNMQGNALVGSGNDLGQLVGIGIRSDGGLNMCQNTPGSNIFIGYLNGSNNTSGQFNIFLGRNCGQFNTTGEKNIFIGQNTGYFNTSGVSNTFVGQQSGFSNSTGYNNTFVGQNSGHETTTAGNDTFFGQNSGTANTTGSSNTYIGANVAPVSTTGSNNTFVGQYAANQNTTGSYNTAVGQGAGGASATGSNGTYLGYSAAPTADGLTNSTAIGFMAQVGQSNALVLGGTGSYAVNVGIGTTTPSQALQVVGNILASGTITQNSDRRLKTNIAPLTGALANVQKLRGVTYEFVPGKGPAGEQIGFIAQELEKIYPQLVLTDPKTGLKSVNYVQTTPILVEAIKDLQQQVNDLTQRTKQLEVAQLRSTTILEQLHQYLVDYKTPARQARLRVLPTSTVATAR